MPPSDRELAVHSCGPGPCRHDGPDLAARLAHVAAPRDRPLTIDLHCHVLSPAVEELVAGRPERTAELQALARATGSASVDHNARVMLPAAGLRMTSLHQRLQDMDAIGVDVQALSPSPSQYNYWADVELAGLLVHRCNEQIAEICARHPTRLAGLGNVALQHPELAAAQLEEAVRQFGLRGAAISSQAAGCDLDHPHFAPFWRKAEELQCLVFLHPFGSSLGDRLDRYYLSNVIGQPLETTIALSRLIFGGVLDRHPGLRLCAAHGGGYLPYYVGRSDLAFRVRPECAGIAAGPSAYLGRLWYDTVVHDPRALRHLIDTVGASQVVVGTDYPFDMGAYRFHEMLEALGIPSGDRRKILGENAASLLGLSPGRGG